MKKWKGGKVFQRCLSEEIEFITQFKTEFLLPFTGCRKVLGKKPEGRPHENDYCLFLNTKVNFRDS